MKIVKKILFALITFFLGIVLLYNAYNAFSLKILKKDLATVNGYAILEVVSGSMEPTIHVGDIIVIDTKADSFEPEDIITFYDKQGSFVTHRIISIDDKEMLTKGDNNNTQDEITSTDKIVGKYVTKINGGGKLLAAFHSPFTMVMILVIGILVCVLLSTDSNGDPILDEDEKEYKEFLEFKALNNEKKEETSKKEESPKEKNDPVVKEDAKPTKNDTKSQNKKSNASKTKTANKKQTTTDKNNTKKNNNSKKKTKKK